MSAARRRRSGGGGANAGPIGVLRSTAPSARASVSVRGVRVRVIARAGTACPLLAEPDVAGWKLSLGVPRNRTDARPRQPVPHRVRTGTSRDRHRVNKQAFAAIQTRVSAHACIADAPSLCKLLPTHTLYCVPRARHRAAHSRPQHRRATRQTPGTARAMSHVASTTRAEETAGRGFRRTHRTRLCRAQATAARPESQSRTQGHRSQTATMQTHNHIARRNVQA